MIDGDGIDLGPGVRCVFVTWGPHERAGILEEHVDARGQQCGGVVMFDLPGVAEAFPNHELWMVASFEPLTITPSVECSCGHHGWITDGKWIPV